MHKNLCKKVMAECIGTFALVFSGCGAVMVGSLYPDVLPPVAVPVVFGLVVMAMVYALGHVSGAHINPAVTLAFSAVKRFGWREVLPYWAGQFSGALLAMAVLMVSLPAAQNMGVTLPAIGVWQSVLWEFILTFLLMFVVISVATDSRAVGVMAGAAIGGTVMLDAFIGGALTGASMNPARSFAPAVLSGQTEGLWIYFVAPSLGALAAVFTYECVRCEEKTETKKDRAEVKGCC